MIAYAAIHTFGIRLIYPGTIGFFQIILGQSDESVLIIFHLIFCDF